MQRGIKQSGEGALGCEVARPIDGSVVLAALTIIPFDTKPLTFFAYQWPYMTNGPKVGVETDTIAYRHCGEVQLGRRYQGFERTRPHTSWKPNFSAILFAE